MRKSAGALGNRRCVLEEGNMGYNNNGLREAFRRNTDEADEFVFDGSPEVPS